MLIFRKRLNTEIKGIKVPNIREEVKMLQDSDDCNNFVQYHNSYVKLLREFELFGKVALCKLNPEETVILLIGNWRSKQHGLSIPLVKDQVKAQGIYFGKGAEKQKPQENQREKKINENITTWARHCA